MNGRDEPQKAAGGASRRWIVSLALVASGVIGGGILAGTTIASAQNSTPATTSTPAGAMQPGTVSHGPGETVLTGTAAAKVRAAALAAVPGGTIIRVETDSAGSPYEAHVKKSDGNVITVKVDDGSNVTTTESGFGAGAPASRSGGTGP
jgi:hypothetical protein